VIDAHGSLLGNSSSGRGDPNSSRIYDAEHEELTQDIPGFMAQMPGSWLIEASFVGDVVADETLFLHEPCRVGRWKPAGATVRR
jgi:hypothetical protein